MLNGKVALLTGSVGGIGYASAEALAEAGCNIVLNGIEEEEKGVHCADVLSKKYGVESIYVRADLRKIHEIQDLVGRSNEQFGSVDVVVNNAVVRHFALTEDFSAEDWDDAMSVNFVCSVSHNSAFVAWNEVVGLGTYCEYRLCLGDFCDAGTGGLRYKQNWSHWSNQSRCSRNA